MKRNLILAIALFVAVIIAVQNVSAQVTINVPEVKDIFKKKKNKEETKTEQRKTEETKSDNSSNNSSSASSGNSNDSAAMQDQIGRVYLFNKPFGETRGETKSEFTVRDPIYGRLEVNGSLKQAFGFKYPLEKPKGLITFTLDATSLEYEQRLMDGPVRTYDSVRDWDGFECNLTAAEVEKNYLNFVINFLPSSKQTLQCGELSNELSDRITLEPFDKTGKYPVRIGIKTFAEDLRGNPGKSYEIKERFYVNFNEEDYLFAKSNIEKTEELKKAKATADLKNWRAAEREKNMIRSLPEPFLNPGNYPAFPPAKLRALIREREPRIMPLKIAMQKVSNPGWYISKNVLGIPEYQYFSADIFMIWEEKEGRCVLTSYQLGKTYLGGGRYGGVYIRSGTTEGDIDCNVVKK